MRFVKRKEASPHDTGRATAANFDNHAGDLFRIVGRRAQADSTCLLTPEAFLRQRAIVKSIPLGNTPCDPGLSTKVADLRGRAIAKCWRKLAAPAGRELALVLFQGKGKEALASLVLQAPGQLAFMDFPRGEDENSSWRVDDGGTLEPDHFEILFVMEDGGTLEFALSWAGPEGAAIQLLRLEGGSFRPLLEAYRYWAPT